MKLSSATNDNLIEGQSPGLLTAGRDELAQWFKGRCVCILPDNDKPGRDLARKLAKPLRRLRLKLDRVEPPPNGQFQPAKTADFKSIRIIGLRVPSALGGESKLKHVIQRKCEGRAGCHRARSSR